MLLAAAGAAAAGALMVITLIKLPGPRSVKNSKSIVTYKMCGLINRI